MSREIEERFSFPNGEQGIINFYNTLQSIATFDGEYLFKVHRFETNNRNLMMRVRDEGWRTTFTIKEQQRNNYAIEHEVVVSNYDETITMLKLAGHKTKNHYEKLREIFHINTVAIRAIPSVYSEVASKDIDAGHQVELVIDHLPGLIPYIEIEGPLSLINHLACILALEPLRHTIKEIYNQLYGVPVNRRDSNLLFSTALNELNGLVYFNHNLFLSILQSQQERANRCLGIMQ